MSYRISLLVCITASALLCSPTVRAQRVAIAPIAQAGINVPYADFPSLTDRPVCCSAFGLGAGLSGNVGLELSLELPQSLSVSLRGSVGGSRDVLWTRDQIGWSMLRTTNGNKVYPAYATYVLDLASLNLDASALINMPLAASSPWSVSMGAGIVAPLSATYDQYEKIDGDASQILSDSRLPQRDVSTGDISGLANAHFRLIAGVRNERQLSSSTRLMYDLTANVGLSPLLTSGGGALTMYGVRTTIGVFFDLHAGPDTTTHLPEPESEPQPHGEQITTIAETVKEPEPIAEPAIEPVREEEPTVLLTPEPIKEAEPLKSQEEAVTEEPPSPAPVVILPTIKDPVVVEFASVYQLLPYVFFEPGSDRLDQSVYPYNCMTNSDERIQRLIDTAMSADGYARRQYQFNSNLLNVVGYRMKYLYPSARIEVRGYTNGRITDSVLGIAHARAHAISRYLYRCWGIDTSRITVVSSEQPSPSACTYSLRDQADINDAEEENTRCELHIMNEPRLLEPVVARVRMPVEELVGRTFESVVCINTSTPSQSSVEQALRLAELPAVAKISGVIVTGYTDRKGPETINQRISEQRARKAASLLGTSAGKLRIDWIGEGARGMRAPYTNDTALGRMLNRCAEVRRTWTVSQQP